MDYVGSSAVRFTGYFTDYLFVPVELYVWQILVLSSMMIAFIWMTFEIRGYQPSLQSWSSLTDAMFEDGMETRKEAFSTYMRWKREQRKPRRWMPGIILDYFGSPSHDDLERPERGEQSEQIGTSLNPQASGTSRMEVEQEGEQQSETESEKKRRYQLCTITVTWMLTRRCMMSQPQLAINWILNLNYKT